MKATTCDVAVVGNGVIAMMVAAELLHRGTGSVCLVGKADRIGGASAAAGAMLGCIGEVTAEAMRGQATRDRLRTSVSAHQLWPSLLASLQDDLGADEQLCTATDTIVMLNSIGGELDSRNFAAIREACELFGQPHETLDPAEVPGYQPATTQRALVAVRLAAEGAVDARLLLAALERRITRTGGRFVDDQVRSISQDQGGSFTVSCSEAAISAGRVVVAAGAYSSGLVAELLADRPLMPQFAGLGTAVLIRRPAGSGFRSVVRTPNRAFACGLHVVPQSGGREYYGATNAVVRRPTAMPMLGDQHFLADCALNQLDTSLFHGEVERWLTGNRPVSLDGFPLVGGTDVEGLYLVCGTYRDGLHLAPLIAAHLADEIAGKSGSLGNQFEPHRVPRATRTIAESIEDYAQHRLATWCEQGGAVPGQMSLDSLLIPFRQQARQVYERLEISFGLGPDILMHLISSGGDSSTPELVRYLSRL